LADHFTVGYLEGLDPHLFVDCDNNHLRYYKPTMSRIFSTKNRSLDNLYPSSFHAAMLLLPVRLVLKRSAAMN
jgi:hypothetical protein